MSRFALGIDLGGTNVKAAIVDSKGRILTKSSSGCEPQRGPGAVIADAADLCANLIREAKIERSILIGAGLGSPGPLNFSEGKIIHSANLPGWKNVPIRDELSRKLGLPVVLDNDANAAGFGEFWAGAGRECSDMVLLTLGTGVGSGVIVRGELLHGHFENAGELGHMIVQPGGIQCPCGQRGCLEQYSSASAVARRVQAEIDDGRASSLREKRVKGESITSRDVAEAARGGDEVASRIWNDACRFLAIGCVNIQHAYNPAMIVLGGGLAEAGDFLIEPVRRMHREETWHLMNDRPEIARAKLGYDAGVIGAAGLAWHRYGANQK